LPADTEKKEPTKREDDRQADLLSSDTDEDTDADGSKGKRNRGKKKRKKAGREELILQKLERLQREPRQKPDESDDDFAARKERRRLRVEKLAGRSRPADEPEE